MLYSTLISGPISTSTFLYAVNQSTCIPHTAYPAYSAELHTYTHPITVLAAACWQDRGRACRGSGAEGQLVISRSPRRHDHGVVHRLV